MPKKFLVIINGPLCSGKSTVAKLLSENKSDIFHISGDKIKWFISDYSSEKYTKTGIINRLLLSLVSQAAKEGLLIVIEGNIALLKESEEYLKIAEDNNMNFYQCNIEAPYDILLKRFNQRVIGALESKIKISAKTEDDMKSRYDSYQELKNKNVQLFDSSKMSPQQIVKEIEKNIIA